MLRRNIPTESKGLNINNNQRSNVPRNLKHEIITVPSTSQFAFGSPCTIDFKEKNVNVHELILAFNTTPVTGLTGSVTSYPNLSPVFHWFQRLEIIQNNIVLDTLYPDAQFILSQLMYDDEDRALNNYSAGHYASIVQRNAMSITTSTWYLNLRTLFNQAHIALITPNHDLQIKVYMQPLANICNQSTLTGTPICTINSASLIARVTRLDSDGVFQTLASMAKSPKHYLYYETKLQSFNINSGVSTTSLNLTSIVGNVSVLYFIVRPTASTTGNNAFSFSAITSFSVNTAGGENIVGGAVIPSTLNLLQQGKWWAKSSYLSESFSGVSNAYVYTYSFSADPALAMLNGGYYTTRKFTGSEQIQITFTGSLGANTQIDVFAYVESAIEQTATSVKKWNITN